MRHSWNITAALACMMMLGSGLSASGNEERNVPEEFRHVGTYKLTKRVKIRDGKSFPVAIGAIYYDVYTDGISARCYGGKGDAFTEFEIYRRDGIVVRREDGLTENIPGIQAKAVVGNVLRQLSLTGERMTLSRFPGVSDIVEITYSERVNKEDLR